MRLLIVIPLFLVSALYGGAEAHPGSLAKDGCHFCRTNCEAHGVVANERHCHKSSAAPVASRQSSSAAGTPPAFQAVGRYRQDRSWPGEVLRVDYEGFSVWLDCDRRGAVAFRYNAQRDSGDHKRSSDFFFDGAVPRRCQQLSTGSYRGRVHDRGHLVPANHLDGSALAIKQSNTMINILPQAFQMNRGAWYRTEEIIECYRDIDELLVLGGVIWGDSRADDHYVRSHGVETPDAFWKVVLRNDRVIAWVVPNNAAAVSDRLDDYLVSVAEVERLTGRPVSDIPDYLKHDRPSASWLVPRGCNKG